MKVYNFEVEEYHTYYVGAAEVLVHNDNCGKSDNKSESTQPVLAHLCSSKVKKFLCVHPFLRKLCYNSFDDLHLYAVIPVTFDLIFPIYSIQVNPRNYKLEVITYCLNGGMRSMWMIYQIHKLTSITYKSSRKGINDINIAELCIHLAEEEIIHFM